MTRAIPSATTTFLLILATSRSLAQCLFDPTITPDDLILCPNSPGELTTQVYDSYQWYRSGAPLADETGQTLSVNAFEDAGYQFTVEATLAGCTEMSAPVLVDAWAFAGATIMTTGAEPLYFSQNGPVYCGLDTVLLIMMSPFNTNVQWLNNGQPLPGATDDTLVVTTPGNFTANGEPAVCPGFVQNPGVEVGILFTTPIQPVIMMGDASMCVTPEGVAYQWYLNGAPIAGDTPCIVPSVAGTYTVDVVYDPDCSIPSDAFLVTGVDEEEDATIISIFPSPANDRITVTAQAGSVIGQWQLLDPSGRVVLQGTGLKRTSAAIDVSTLRNGTYRLRTSEGRARAVVIAR